MSPATTKAVKTLESADTSRYGRQLVLPEIGPTGQRNLLNSSVLIVGAGGLGSPIALYLAGVGIGRMGIMDDDVVELSNLQRQVIHSMERLGMPKTDSAVKSCRLLNDRIRCDGMNERLTATNAMAIISDYDIIVDATDSVDTRYLLNDACVLLSKPLVAASAVRLDGQISTYNHQGSPCYRCVFPNAPVADAVTSCAESGVLGVVPGIIGCLQALEVTKIAAGLPASYTGKLVLFDAMSASFQNIKISKSEACIACGPEATLRELIDTDSSCARTPLATHVLDPSQRLSCQEYADLKSVGESDDVILIDTRPPIEFEICALPDAISFMLNSPSLSVRTTSQSPPGDEGLLLPTVFPIAPTLAAPLALVLPAAFAPVSPPFRNVCFSEIGFQLLDAGPGASRVPNTNDGAMT
ncbi:hypothetical protein, variant [Sphaeroforma arctica JP610]|uniref:Rhodanese domain-containing protein n=1 Tax=Sphaeroforma arctica JP610 TaxID=667725 RepID=A0A0L0FTD3_9EUKA|nr:hypothetical protein, variant [Sphaeroforma arctica JP610]KNC79821.1 hypothetical protein, variant [Sphaeroforma arctica JP610]|eukprot:XP_014153723.1 hypothetical protein, variant [Sphaeroforma arctica JP610]